MSQRPLTGIAARGLTVHPSTSDEVGFAFIGVRSGAKLGIAYGQGY